MKFFVIKSPVLLNNDRERKHFERAIRKNGNISMLDFCLYAAVATPSLDMLGEKLRETYNNISAQELPNAFVILLNEFDVATA